MKYIINNKIYDTERSEKILTYIKQIPHEIFNFITYPRYRHTLYKSKKGQFFVHVGEYIEGSKVLYNNKDYIELLSDKEVKEILNKLNDVKNFKKLFPGDWEEG